MVCSYVIGCSHAEYLSYVLCIICTAVASLFTKHATLYPGTSLVSASSVLASVPAMY